MKVAIVNDTLDEFGGAERVTKLMLRSYPRADFFTAFYDPWILNTFFPQFTHGNLHTSWKFITYVATHRSLIQMFSPLLWRSFDFSGYDVVISNPSFLMCNLVVVPPNVLNVQYIHAVPKNIFNLLPKTPLQKRIPYDIYVRALYRQSVRSTPHLFTSSVHMQKKISKIFGVTAHILPPPIAYPKHPPVRKKGEYYLYVSRIDRDKHIELAIEACNKLKMPLFISGRNNEPRYEAYLREIAGPTVQFLGFCSDAKVRELYKRAIAFLFPSKEEDFGLAPLEALAHGVPVVAYYGGGPKETLVEGVTGTFFRNHTAGDMVRAMTRLNRKRFDPNALYRYAARYGEEEFSSQLVRYIRREYEKKKRLATL